MNLYVTSAVGRRKQRQKESKVREGRSDIDSRSEEFQEAFTIPHR